MTLRARAGVLPALVLAGLAATSPLWNTIILSRLAALTVGRVWLLALAASGLVGLWSARRSVARTMSRPARIAMGAALACALVATISAMTNGCTCDGAIYGLLEFTAVVLGAALALRLAPGAAPLVLGGVVVGALVLAGLSMLGVGDLHTSLVAPQTTDGNRLGGPLGNPNLLALHLAFALVVIVAGVAACRGAARRMALLLLLSALAVTLVLSFSRGGAIAALAGAGAAALTAVRVRSTRRTVAAIAALGALGLLGVLVGPFASGRVAADSGAITAQSAAIDRSGWDARAEGPIPRGVATLDNPLPGVLRFSAASAEQGMSLPLPPTADAGGSFTVRFTARSAGARLAIAYALQDNLIVGPSSIVRGVVSARTRRFGVTWHPETPSRNPRFYVWATAAAGAVDLVGLRIRTPGSDVLRDGPLRLQGNLGEALARAEQRRYIDSRVQVARTAVHVFSEHPLLGVGWQRFPALARRQLGDLGAYATHDEPLRFAAELGLLGLLPLLVAGAGLTVAAWRLPPGYLRGAAVGGLVAGGVGLLFVNGLAQPTVTVHLAVICGLVLGLSPRSEPHAASRPDAPAA